MVSLIRRNLVTVDRSDDRPGATLVDIAASFNRLPESERRESEIVGFPGGLGAVSGNAIADEPSTDGRRRGSTATSPPSRSRRSAAIPRPGIAYRSTASPGTGSLDRCWPTWTS